MMAMALSAHTFRVAANGFAWVLSPVGPLAYFPAEVTQLRDQRDGHVLGYRAPLAAYAPDYPRGGTAWTPQSAAVPWALYQSEFLINRWQRTALMRGEEPPDGY